MDIRTDGSILTWSSPDIHELNCLNWISIIERFNSQAIKYEIFTRYVLLERAVEKTRNWKV